MQKLQSTARKNMTITVDCNENHEPHDLDKVWCGGQERIRKLRTWSNSVQTVNKVDRLLPQHCYIHGIGQLDPGNDYMWTLQVQWRGKCS